MSRSALAPFSEMQNFRNIMLNAITALLCVQHEVIRGMHLAALSNNARVGFAHSLKNVLHYWRIARDLSDVSRLCKFAGSHRDARLSSQNDCEWRRKHFIVKARTWDRWLTFILIFFLPLQLFMCSLGKGDRRQGGEKCGGKRGTDYDIYEYIAITWNDNARRP